MRTGVKITLGLAVTLLLCAGLFGWLLWRTHTGERDAYLGLTSRIASVEQRLEAQQDPLPADLERFAKDPATRRVLYDALEHHGRLALFPAQYLTAESIAEADLVLWLTHPNELAAPPDEIELMKTVSAPGDSYVGQRYFVFRYRTHAPHWAAKDGWLAGVADPYPADGTVVTGADGTFSRFEAYESRTPEEHVRITHDVVMEKR